MYECLHGIRGSRRGSRFSSGFSLLEMIVVVAIITILAGIAVPMVGAQMRRERHDATEKEVEVLGKAIEAYFADGLELPETLDSLVVDPRVPGWAGPYVSPGAQGPRGHRQDAWGNDYEVVRDGESRLALVSSGDQEQKLDDDIVFWIDVTPIRRRITLERLGLVNGMIERFSRERSRIAPPGSVGALIELLWSQGYLPREERFVRDAWGGRFVADPPGLFPIVRVTSRRFLEPDRPR